MKTTKIILITALIALGAILYGQAEKSSRFENLVNDFLCMNERTDRIGYSGPVVYMSYTLDQAEAVYEKQYGTENWMTAHFAFGVTEADLPVEEWMTRPFGNNGAEADPFIEKWMTAPFEAAEYIEIESWMTTAF